MVVFTTPKAMFSRNMNAIKLCLYKILKPSLLPCKIFGLFPVTCMHKQDRCNFRTSKLLVINSLVCAAISFLIILRSTTALVSAPKTRTMHEIINYVTDVTYGTFMTLLVVLGFAKGPKFASALNKLSLTELLCQNALNHLHKAQRIHLIVTFASAALEFVTIIFIFTVENILAGLVRSSIFLSYTLTSCMSFFFACVFGCFEGAFSTALLFTPVHPLNFDQAQSKVCRGNHRRYGEQNEEKIVEHFRRLHENICLVFYEVNGALGPTHLLLVLVEITMLVLHWYVVVLYAIGGGYASNVVVSNCFFVVTHMLSLLQYLRSCQLLHNKVRVLKNYLLEYSTRTTDVRVLLQVRLFLEKLNRYEPTNACGIFDVDLGIAGPICANILTYVLVALQFEVTK